MYIPVEQEDNLEQLHDKEQLKIRMKQLQQEIENERKQYLRWMELADLFCDTLQETASKYELVSPEVVKEKEQNRLLRSYKMLAEYHGQYRRLNRVWEKQANLYHDTIWNVLLTYEPEKYDKYKSKKATELKKPDSQELTRMLDFEASKLYHSI